MGWNCIPLYLQLFATCTIWICLETIWKETLAWVHKTNVRFIKIHIAFAGLAQDKRGNSDPCRAERKFSEKTMKWNNILVNWYFFFFMWTWAQSYRVDTDVTLTELKEEGNSYSKLGSTHKWIFPHLSLLFLSSFSAVQKC